MIDGLRSIMAVRTIGHHPRMLLLDLQLRQIRMQRTFVSFLSAKLSLGRVGLLKHIKRPHFGLLVLDLRELRRVGLLVESDIIDVHLMDAVHAEFKLVLKREVGTHDNERVGIRQDEMLRR